MSPMYLSQCGTITPFYVDPFSHDSHLSFSFKRTNPSNGKTSNMNFMTCPRSFSFLFLCYSEHGCWVGFSLILQKILTAIRPLCWKMLGGWQVPTQVRFFLILQEILTAPAVRPLFWNVCWKVAGGYLGKILQETHLGTGWLLLLLLLHQPAELLKIMDQHCVYLI